MSRGLKRFFIVCAVAACAGLVFAAAGLVMGGTGGIDRVSDKYDWISGSPGEMKYIDAEHASDFSSLKIRGDMDVRISKGDRDAVRIGSGENLNPPKVQYESGTLIVDGRDEHSGITINFSSGDYAPFIEVTCSDKRVLESIDIETENGDVEIEGVEADKIIVDAEYGEVCFDGVTFGRGELDVENGDIKCTDITSRGLKIENEYGDCSLAGTIAGVCDVEMENGSLQIDTDLAEELYNVSAGTESGTLCIGEKYQDDFECRYNGGSGANKLKLFSEYGDVKVNFDCKKSGYRNGTSDGASGTGTNSGSGAHGGEGHQNHGDEHE